jgi:hypothetical protein
MKVCSSTVFQWAPYGTNGVWHDNCYDYAFDLNNPRSVNRNGPGNMAGNKAIGLTFRNCHGIAKRVLEDYRGLAYRLKRSTTKCRPGYYKVMNFVAPGYGDFHWYRETRLVKYRTRPGDTVASLAKFFRVTQAVIKAAFKKAHRANNMNNGRIATANTELRMLNSMNQMTRTGKLTVGKVMEIPVRLWSHKQGFGAGPVIVDASGKTIRNPLRANKNYGDLNYSKFCSAYCVKCGAGRVALARARKAHRAY